MKENKIQEKVKKDDGEEGKEEEDKKNECEK